MSIELPRFILDSFALLSHLQGKGGQGRLIDLLEKAGRSECHLMMSLINLGEVCYIIERQRGLKSVQLALAAIDSLPIEVLLADRDIVLGAAHLKAQFPISYADAFAAASAQAHSAILITGDPEFKALTKFIQIEWLPN